MRLHEADPSKLLGDKGYDSDEIRRDLIDQGIEPVIPPRSNLKQFRRIATRYEKDRTDIDASGAAAAGRLGRTAKAPRLSLRTNRRFSVL
jgi:Transposase DDE domain